MSPSKGPINREPPKAATALVLSGRTAHLPVVSHQVPFYYLRFLVLRQFPEYLSKVLAQHSEYSLLALLQYKYYVVLTVTSRVA